MADESAQSPDVSDQSAGRPASNGGLSGRGILVVGASAGIGRAFAEHAIKSGGRVVVTSRRADRLAALVADAPHGYEVVGDIRKQEDCERIVAEEGQPRPPNS